ncbi:hypothetical protein TELCIR_23850 [Teladorsagia circumcincta]|uniref:Aromatic-L-amino-acid decarboxylase n=1 Tax=Teladorsagia circumcincta TaxID=45464 RepID=A0A2G9TA71_TELCI|nr:hypothetical protein TELCIR_23850 [Teladorsagia circumcincta]
MNEDDSGIITPHFHDPVVFEKLIAYCSDQAHSSVDKDVMLCGVKMRKLRSTIDPELKNYTVTKETLETAIKIAVVLCEDASGELIGTYRDQNL